jgi:hypothetical protein
MRTHDSLGRRFVNQPVSTGKRLKPLSKEKVEVLEAIHWLGVASSDNIRELLRLNGLKDATSNSKIIRDLVNEDNTEDGDTYLNRPEEQFPDPKLARPNGHLHVVHDLGIGGINLLKRQSRYVPGIIHGGHWNHQVMESTILWELYLGVKQNRDYTFIPHHRTTSNPNQYEVPVKLEGKVFNTVLRPDAHFAIDYGGTKRHFFFEADRGTEQRDKILTGKKTLERSLRQYRAFIGSFDGSDPLYHKPLDTRAPATALFVFSKKSKCEAAMELLHKITEGKGNNYIYFRHDERFESESFAPPKLSLQNWQGEWMRVARPPVRLDI